METSLRKCENAILRAPSLEINDLIQNAKSLTKKAKSLTSVEVITCSIYISLPLSLVLSLSYHSLSLSFSLSETVYISDV